MPSYLIHLRRKPLRMFKPRFIKSAPVLQPSVAVQAFYSVSLT